MCSNTASFTIKRTRLKTLTEGKLEYIWDLLVNLHWAAVGQIIMIDILLGGDNAVVIAMA